MPDEPVNLTVRILREIRDEIRKTNSEIRKTNERVEELRTDLGTRIVESELRTATALTDLASTVREMTGVLRAQNDLRPRLERCERDIEDLRTRIAG